MAASWTRARGRPDSERAHHGPPSPQSVERCHLDRFLLSQGPGLACRGDICELGAMMSPDAFWPGKDVFAPQFRSPVPIYPERVHSAARRLDVSEEVETRDQFVEALKVCRLANSKDTFLMYNSDLLGSTSLDFESRLLQAWWKNKDNESNAPRNDPAHKKRRKPLKTFRQRGIENVELRQLA